VEQVSSIFKQILKFFPRTIFDAAVNKHEAEKHAKGMTCWSQFIALMFCHLGGARSLREIIGGLAASEGKLKHLGVGRAPTRSTLAYANGHRPWQLYETVFQELVKVCQCEAREKQRQFRFQHPLLSLDSTVIPVCASMFDWAKYVKTKGAIKVHTVLDNRSILPQYAVITEGKTADVQVARLLKFEPGAIVVMDRGYEDHDWWRKLTADGVFFVSRLKDSTSYGIVEELPLPADAAFLRDEVILLASDKNKADAMRLRRIEVWVEDKKEAIVFVTNQLKLAASTIAAIYRDRWQIELFFDYSTWCTPLDVHGISRVSCSESAVGGGDGWFRPATHRSTSSLRRIQGAPTQACVARNCFTRINRKTVVGVTPRAMAASLTDISLRACRSPTR
jgi:hypothetical protein